MVGTTLKFMRGDHPHGLGWILVVLLEMESSGKEQFEKTWPVDFEKFRGERDSKTGLGEKKVRPNLQWVHTFGIPLVKVTNQETLEKEVIKLLLAV